MLTNGIIAQKRADFESSSSAESRK